MSSSQPRTPHDADAILDALDPEQREVAANPLGPMCVLAGAGTGKTRAITHRIAYGVHSGQLVPQRVLAVTFTARAAGEMRTRLRELDVAGVQARTFHSAALRQLHYFWPRAIGGAAPEIIAHKAPVVGEAGARMRLQLDRAAIRDLASEIEWSKVSMLTPETYVDAARRARREPPGLDLTAMARLLQVYEDVKADRGVIDFEDVLLVMAGILETNPAIAGEVRSQYRHFVVDEYQDVNAVQQRLLDLWVGDRGDVCVVGDAAQTIYSFTGASPRHLLDFTTNHPGSRTVKLVRNYRSTPQVVGLANLVLAAQARSVHGVGARSLVRLEAQKPSGAAPTLTAYPDDPAEAKGVAASIAKAIAGGTPAAQVAVLFRTNGQSEAFEQALADEGVPYLVRGGERFFSREEVRNALVLLRGQARADDASMPMPDLVRDILAGAGWSPQAPGGGGRTRERWESLQALVNLAEDLVAVSPGARLPDLVADLTERSAAQHAPTVQGVTLASLHSTKGLEWDVVYLVGCSDGLMPITMAQTPEEIEEERRLLYVGLTRARSALHLSWAQARNPGGRASRRPSRFLDDAADVLGEGARSQPKKARGTKAGPGRPKLPAHCRSCGAELVTAAQRKVGRCDDCPPTYDEGVFENLRSWRRQVAAAGSVPAYVVFTDATLTAIAEARPETKGALARVNGVGAMKLERYGDAVLAILGGADPDEIASAATDSA